MKKHQYFVRTDKLSGDAPKDFICVYEYGGSRKASKKTWVRYIAKVGHKWYPSESITEHLITRLGQEWGFNVAPSKLYFVSGQIRFCSEFFRKPEQELVHGADILARHLQESNADFIEQIDKKGWSQELLSLQFVQEAIDDVFPTHMGGDTIFGQLIKMLLFDAAVGNNDRHFFNWGILRDLKGRHQPYFSPIYDTARGLFGNYEQKKVLNLLTREKDLQKHFVRYSEGSKPKIGWEGRNSIDHAQLVELLLLNGYCTFAEVKDLFGEENLNKAKLLVNSEFQGMITEERKRLILFYLQYRFEAFNKLLNR